MRKRSSSSNCETGRTAIAFSTAVMPSTRRTRCSMSSLLYGIVTQPVRMARPFSIEAETLSKIVYWV